MADNVKYHCSKCGAPAAANDWFCTKCGGSIIQGAAEMINPNNGANSAYNEQNNANNYSAYNNTQNNNANDYSAYNNTQNNNANDYSAYNNAQNNNANNYSAYNNTQNNNNAGYTAAGAYSAYNNQNDNNAANNNPYGQNSYDPNNANNNDPANNYNPNNGDFYSQNANTQNSAPEKKKGGLGKIIKLAAIAVAVIAIIGIAAALLFTFVFNTSNFVERDTVISCVYDEANDKTLILVNGKVLKDTIDGHAYVDDSNRSLDGKTAIIYTYDRNEETGERTREYYTFRNKKLKKIDADIRGLMLSQNGDVVVYVPEVDVEDVTDISDISYELVWYKVSNGETKTITNKYLSSYKLSPDGKSVLFVEGDSDDSSMKLWSNGKTTEIKDNAKPELVSNDAKYIYYTEYDEDDGESTLYVMKNKKKSDAIKLGTDMNVLFANVDNTEVFLSSRNDKGEYTYYICKNGKDKVKIDADIDEFVAPNDSAGIKHLKNLYFINDEGVLCYLNSKLKVVEVLDKDISYGYTDKSGKVVYCVDKDGTLYRGKGTKEDKFDDIADDVLGYRITSNGSACYYTTKADDGDTELYYVKKNGEAKVISNDIDRDSFTMTHDDYALFREDVDVKDGEGTLYSSRNGSEKKKIADDVYSVSAGSKYTSYTVVDDDKKTTYIATSGTNFKEAYSFKIETGVAAPVYPY